MFPIFRRRHLHACFELSHKMQIAFIAAHSGNLSDGKVGGGEQIFGMFDTTPDDIVYYTDSEDFFIQMLKIGLAHGKLMGKSFHVPVMVGHVVDFGTKNGHLIIVGIGALIACGMQLLTELDKEQSQVKRDGILPVMIGGILLVTHILDDQRQSVQITDGDDVVKGDVQLLQKAQVFAGHIKMKPIVCKRYITGLIELRSAFFI